MAALELVAHEVVLFAEVEFAVEDDGVGPGFRFLMDGHEGTFEFVAIGGGFDEGDVAALVAVDKVAIDVGEAGGAVADSFFRPPFYFAGFDFETDGVAAVVLVAAVYVVFNKDHAAMVVL